MIKRKTRAKKKQKRKIKLSLKKKKDKPLDIISIGNTSLDTIFLGGRKFSDIPGGSAPAVITAATAYNCRGGIVTKIGEDYPSNLLVELTSRGIDLKGASTKKTSCRFELTYNSKGNLKKFNEIFTTEEALSFKDIPKSYMRAKHFHLAAAHPSNQKKFLSYSNSKATISLALWPTYEDEYTPKFIELLNQVEILFCNNHEVKMLAKEENIYDAVKALQKRGPKVIVLTKGKNGSAIYHKGEFYLYPALRTSFIDTTGCGDSFAGGFLAEYLKSKDVEKAGWVGTALASFTISKVGSWFPPESQTRIDQRIARAKEWYKKESKSKLTLMDFF